MINDLIGKLKKTGFINIKEIISDLEKIKEEVRKELYGQMLTKAEYEGACERLIGHKE